LPHEAELAFDACPKTFILHVPVTAVWYTGKRMKEHKRETALVGEALEPRRGLSRP
jgi:hypothetical protein